MKFIRIDQKGHWRGKEHKSSIGGLGEFADVEDTVAWEEGISCYKLKSVADGIENLRYYWTENNYMTSANDYEKHQVTIFEGEIIGEGADFEELAECTKTIAEIEAVEFMKRVFEAYEELQDEKIEEDEYHEKLEKIYKELV